MLSHGDTPVYQNVKEQRWLTFIVKINYFHIEIKVMNVRNTSYHDDTLMCQTLYDYAKDKRSCGPNQQLCHKPWKFEVKGQYRIRIMNVRDSSSHDDTSHVPNMVSRRQTKKMYKPDTNLQTDGQNDSFIHPRLRSRGVQKSPMQFSLVCENMVWSWTQRILIFSGRKAAIWGKQSLLRSIDIAEQDPGGSRMAQTML